MNIEYLVFAVVCLTSLGLVIQCASNLRTRRAAFLAFPIALLIQLPYPLWALLAWLSGDLRLLLISLIMGLPTAWLSIQFFQFEWSNKAGLAGEDKVTWGLVIIGFVLLMSLIYLRDLPSALAVTAAYLTCCISIFSYLVKIWRVAGKHENLDGLKWSTLIPLCIFYMVMVYVGRISNVMMLSWAYVFSVAAISLAMLYKVFARTEVPSSTGV